MLSVKKVLDMYIAEVTDKEGNLLVAKSESSEADALSFLSHLTSTLIEGYRSTIVREGF